VSSEVIKNRVGYNHIFTFPLHDKRDFYIKEGLSRIEYYFHEGYDNLCEDDMHDLYAFIEFYIVHQDLLCK
jgi:hypothetical protein